MVRKFAIVFGIIGFILGSLYVALTLGLFDLPDSLYFYNLGNFLLFKRYYSIFPFNSYYPSTTNAPFYGIVARLLGSDIHLAMTLISFSQLLLVGISAYLIYESANYIKRGLGWLAAGMFLLLPFLLTYAVVMMSEVFTIFLVSVYLYLALGLIAKRVRVPPSVLILVACLLTLTKFVFLYFIPVSIILTLYFEFQMRKKEKFHFVLFRQLPGVIGIVFVCMWAGFVHSYYGRWGMTVTTGRELFHGIVWKSGLQPSADSPAMKTFQHWTGLSTIPRIMGYEMEGYFRTPFDEKKITEPKIDDVFRDFAITAAKQHPASFFFDIFRGIYGNFTSPPYHVCLLSDLGVPDAACAQRNAPACRIPWFCSLQGCSDTEQGAMCQPAIHNTTMTSLWASLISLYEGYYPFVMIGVFILMCFGGIVGLVKRSFPLILIAFHCGLLLGLQGIISAVEGRYTMIAYPFIAILVAYGIRTIMDGVRRKLSIRR